MSYELGVIALDLISSIPVNEKMDVLNEELKKYNYFHQSVPGPVQFVNIPDRNSIISLQTNKIGFDFQSDKLNQTSFYSKIDGLLAVLRIFNISAYNRVGLRIIRRVSSGIDKLETIKKQFKFTDEYLENLYDNAHELSYGIKSNQDNIDFNLNTRTFQMIIDGNMTPKQTINGIQFDVDSFVID
ncbi:hypothetical protein, partial [Alkalibacter mobilis]|uniref:hypothetical protein n=1 Tax=Alkalibacter mobilis TaxID=2787712 RepID=UPI0018A0BF62